MKWGGEFFFSLFVRDRDILRACIDYLNYRSYGVFFSYLGVVVLSLYTGISRTTVIIYNALVMGLANVVLNYCLVFGNWGFPEMGIGGSALASTLSEILAFLVFVFYIFNDKKLAPYKIFEVKPIDVNLIKAQIKLSIPMILQTFASLGSWFLFFALIEQIGRNELAISNIMRTVYMLFMIPAWGFSSGINTIVSNLIGKRAYRDVIQAINKTALLCFSITMFLGFLLYLFPSIILRIGTNDEYLIEQSKRLIWVLVSILAFYSVSIIYFNGMVGTGATKVALYIQVFCVFLYIAYVYYVVGIQKASLEWSWMAENVYMISSLIISVLYMRSHSWIKLKI
jgi:putative MATE family efflux protein